MTKAYLASPGGQHRKANPNERMPEELKKRPGQTQNVTISVFPRDAQLITALTKFFGCSRSEAVRTAIRHMAAHVGPLNLPEEEK